MSNPKPNIVSNSEEVIKTATQKEILRQSQWAFNIYVGAMALSLGVSVIGCCLLLTGKSTEGTVTAAAGLTSSTVCFQLGKESQEKLKMLLTQIQDLS